MLRPELSRTSLRFILRGDSKTKAQVVLRKLKEESRRTQCRLVVGVAAARDLGQSYQLLLPCLEPGHPKYTAQERAQDTGQVSAGVAHAPRNKGFLEDLDRTQLTGSDQCDSIKDTAGQL